uniref:Uncharacterized protein n=1 Tax=Caulobacter sp. (strain K31) TaxID=366602 RepID=B0T8P7_CAUSK
MSPPKPASIAAAKRQRAQGRKREDGRNDPNVEPQEVFLWTVGCGNLRCVTLSFVLNALGCREPCEERLLTINRFGDKIPSNPTQIAVELVSLKSDLFASLSVFVADLGKALDVEKAGNRFRIAELTWH